MTNVTRDGFHDHFSAVAAGYARHRPTYPAALYDWLAGLPEAPRLAWDCGTGSGQAAVELAGRFDRVVATDASAEQLARVPAHPRLETRQAKAEESGLETGSVDLVTVAQAVHWFDLDRFWAEVRRVLAPGGAVAVWTYDVFRLSPAVDAVVDRFYRRVVGPYWPPERKVVESGYAELPFPFDEIAAPPFEMTACWDVERLLGYLRTWSAAKRWTEAHGGRDAVAEVEAEVRRAWRTTAPSAGCGEEERHLRWTLGLRAGRP
jgi:SAM-dependent methyltransferase